MITDSELREIEQRCDIAQRGPWMVGITERHHFLVISHTQPAVRVNPKLLPKEIQKRLAEWMIQDEHGYIEVCPEAEIDPEVANTLAFIAHSRTDVPKLLAEIKRLKNPN